MIALGVMRDSFQVAVLAAVSFIAHLKSPVEFQGGLCQDLRYRSVAVPS
jgi:hypothetical protein